MGEIIKTADRAATRHWHHRWTREQGRAWQAYCLHNRAGWIEAERKKAEAAAAKAERVERVKG
jgi:hypothetical protein